MCRMCRNWNAQYAYTSWSHYECFIRVSNTQISINATRTRTYKCINCTKCTVCERQIGRWKESCDHWFRPYCVFVCVRSMIIAPKCHKINAMALIYWLNLTSLWYRTIYNELNAHTAAAAFGVAMLCYMKVAMSVPVHIVWHILSHRPS